MSLADRVSVHAGDFTAIDDGSVLSDEPIWRSLIGAPSPICYSNIVIAPEFGVTNVQHGAIIEGSYPGDQFCSMQILDANAGPSNTAQGLGIGLRASGVDADTLASYRVNVSGTDSNITIFRFDPAGSGATVLHTIAYTPADNDWITAEVESDGAGGCDIRVYDKDEVLLADVNDPVELIGATMYLALSYTDEHVFITGFDFGYLDIESARTLDNVNTDYQVNSLGQFVANGSGLAGVTGGNISFTGLRPYELTIIQATDSAVNITPVDILVTQLQLGVLRLTLYHPDGELTITFDQLPEVGWQYVTLAGATGGYIDKDLGAVDGDQICVPSTVGFSSVVLFADGDVHFDGALNQGQTMERRFFDKSTFLWESGTVTINQAGAGLAPPVWRSTPAPPAATVGVFYTYPIGYLVDGDRPMNLSDAGVPLPNGLFYNDIGYPETIQGTINSGSGTITVSGIITNAENGA